MNRVCAAARAHLINMEINKSVRETKTFTMPPYTHIAGERECPVCGHEPYNKDHWETDADMDTEPPAGYRYVNHGDANIEGTIAAPSGPDIEPIPTTASPGDEELIAGLREPIRHCKSVRSSR